jgi:hypothetical protein
VFAQSRCAAARRSAARGPEGAPGEVLRATLIDIEADAAAAAARMAQFEARSRRARSAAYFGGGARLSSDFRIKDEGYGRLVVAAGQLGPVDLARRGAVAAGTRQPAQHGGCSGGLPGGARRAGASSMPPRRNCALFGSPPRFGRDL